MSASPRLRPGLGTALNTLPPLLAVGAEACWIGVVYALVEAAAHRPAPLGAFGPLGLALFSLAGLVAARRLEPRMAGGWPTAAVALVVAGGTVGWLVEPAALRALLAGDGAASLAAHPGGWLAGLALLRGIAHLHPAAAEQILSRLLGGGVLVLGAAALVGGALGEPWRATFTGSAVIGSVGFLGLGTAALAVARMEHRGSLGGFDWRANPAWLGLAVALVGVGVAAALPISFGVGEPIRALISALVLPLFLVGLVAGLGQTSRRSVLSVLLLGGALVVLAVVGTVRDLPAISVPNAGVPADSGSTDPRVLLIVAACLVAAMLLLVFVLAKAWMTRVRGPAAYAADDQRFASDEDRQPAAAGGPRFRRRHHPGAPGDAPEAYLALLRELGRRPQLRRLASESPAEHAGRLRATGRGAIGLDLLVADYELARFAGEHLSDAEHRRALSRWRRLRSALVAHR